LTATELLPVVPNPAFGATSLRYSVAARGTVELAVYSIDGRRVKTLARGVAETGRYSIKWDGTDERGTRLGAGVYYARLKTAGLERTRLITLVR